MNYSKKENPFFEIDYSNRIVFFEDSHRSDLEFVDSSFRFIKLNNKTLAENILQKYEIEKLPCIMLYGHKIYLDEDCLIKMKAVEKEKDNILDKKINQIINSGKVVLFMKGSIEEPYCRFSKGIVDMLKECEVDLDRIVYFDVLMNDEMRDRIKKYNQWPTFPQLFIDGEFVGGFDIVSELHQTGDLNKLIR